MSEGHDEIEEQRGIIYFSDDPMATVIRMEGAFEGIPDDPDGLMNEIQELLDPEGSICFHVRKGFLLTCFVATMDHNC